LKGKLAISSASLPISSLFPPTLLILTQDFFISLAFLYFCDELN